jgi:hypothetical protein
MRRLATAPRAPTQEALRHAQAGEIGGGAQLEEARPRRPRCSPCFDETGIRHRRFAVPLSGGDSLRVTGSRADAAGVLVASQIIRPQGPSIEVDRRLEANDGRYKISDVIVDRVNRALSQRSEFSASFNATAARCLASSRRCTRRDNKEAPVCVGGPLSHDHALS